MDTTKIISPELLSKKDTIAFHKKTENCISIHNQCEQKETFLGVNYDTIFTVTVTLFIFFLGIVIDRWLKKSQEKEVLIKVRNLFFGYYNKFYNNTLIPLTKEFRDFYLEISIDNGVPTTPPLLLTDDFELLNSIDFVKVAESVVYHDTIYKAKNHIYIASNLMKEIREYHNLILIKSDKLRELMQEMTEDYLITVVESLETERNSGNYNSEIWDKVNERIIFYLTKIKGGRSISRFYNQVLLVIQNHLVNSESFRTNQNASEIVRKGKELSRRFYELRIQTIEIKLQYRKTYFAFYDLQNKSKELIREIKRNNWL